MREYSVRGYFLSFEVTGKIGKLADEYFTPSNYTRLRISNIFYTATTNNYPNNSKTIFLRWFFFGFFQGADRILFFYSFTLSRPLTRQCNENHFIRSKLFSR